MTVPQARLAILRGLASRIWIERTVFMRVVEHGSAVVVDEAFGRRALSDDHIMCIELDMKILNLIDGRSLYDGNLIHQIDRLDQDALQVHGMVRRYPQIAPRHALIDRAGLDADRQDIPATKDEATAVTAASDPF